MADTGCRRPDQSDRFDPAISMPISIPIPKALTSDLWYSVACLVALRHTVHIQSWITDDWLLIYGVRQ